MNVLVFANGEISDDAACLSRVRQADRIICADGGTRHALRLGLVPDWVVGDLDSLDAKDRAHLEAAGARFRVYPARKDQTDLELALVLASELQADEVHLVGLLGGRLDQTVANLLLLARDEWRSMRLSLSDGRETAWIVRDRVVIEGAVGDTVSLLSLTPECLGITTRDLEYPLRRGRLTFGSTLGVSNVMRSSTAAVCLESGVLLVIHRAGGD